LSAAGRTGRIQAVRDRPGTRAGRPGGIPRGQAHLAQRRPEPHALVLLGPAPDCSRLFPPLRVKGARGPGVADGSVMPDLVTVNPCITTMAIGEKYADLLKEDADRRPGLGRGGPPTPVRC